MRKLIAICFFAALMLSVNNPANASITITDMVDSSDGQANTYFSSTPTDTDSTRPSPTDTFVGGMKTGAGHIPLARPDPHLRR